MRTYLGLTFVASLLICVGCVNSDADRNSRKEGATTATIDVSESQTVERAVDGVTGVVLLTPATLAISPGASDTLRIVAPPELVPHLTAEVSEHQLQLAANKEARKELFAHLSYKLSLRSLSSVSVEGAGEITGGIPDSEELDVSTSGGGDVTLTGSAASLRIVISGKGRIDTRDLTSKEAFVKIDGDGMVRVNASSILSVTINGVGIVEYKGQPKISKTINGVGDIHGL